MNPVYEEFLESRLGAVWRRVGARRRAGVAVPLFSVYSRKSAGVGEIPDLKLLVDWCAKTGLSIIQLLPMNDMGSSFRPYDAESSVAIDPAYLRVNELCGVYSFPFKKRMDEIREGYSPDGKSVRWAVKTAKLALLWDMFLARDRKVEEDFEHFRRTNAGWLRDYALFRVLKEVHGGAGWESWPDAHRNRRDDALHEIEWKHAERAQFYAWLQWQAALQFEDVKAHARPKGVLLMGDLPFLVARDSADVWARQRYFKLDRVAGAPPDAFFSKGQRWGMPPYDWDAIARDGFEYLKTKFCAAERFYDLFRIDHVVGVFRVWTIRGSESAANHGLNGVFDPPREEDWERHGRWILDAMTQASRMLPCAEDLGVVPTCSERVLADYGVPGIEIQRWTRDWTGSFEFKAPDRYRRNSISMLSTHDSTFFPGWWASEAGTVDTALFERLCRERGIPFDDVSARIFSHYEKKNGRARWRPEIRSADALLEALRRGWDDARPLVDLYRGSFNERSTFLEFVGLAGAPNEREVARAALEKALEAASVFSIQMLWDWLSLDAKLLAAATSDRVNVPGTVSDSNWTLVSPVSLERLNRLPINSTILELNRKWNRI